MKLITTFGLAVILFCTAYANLSHSGTVKLPYQTVEALQGKCRAAGGDFLQGDGGHSCMTDGGMVLCDAKTKKCTGHCSNCGTKSVTRKLSDMLRQPKKRPKVLQEGGGGQSGNVSPTVLGSEPGAPPAGSGGL
jgi:hypothetical protein